MPFIYVVRFAPANSVVSRVTSCLARSSSRSFTSASVGVTRVFVSLRTLEVFGQLLLDLVLDWRRTHPPIHGRQKNSVMYVISLTFYLTIKGRRTSSIMDDQVSTLAMIYCRCSSPSASTLGPWAPRWVVSVCFRQNEFEWPMVGLPTHCLDRFHGRMGNTDLHRGE